MKNVFIVEDNDGIRELLEFLLEDDGYIVKSFPKAKPFLAALDEEIIPDIILLDVMLPDGNGIDLCRFIKSLDEKKTIPIMLMSAHMDLKDDCADDFINKPFDIEKLLAKTRNLINNWSGLEPHI